MGGEGGGNGEAAADKVDPSVLKEEIKRLFNSKEGEFLKNLEFENPDKLPDSDSDKNLGTLSDLDLNEPLRKQLEKHKEQLEKHKAQWEKVGGEDINIKDYMENKLESQSDTRKLARIRKLFENLIEDKKANKKKKDQLAEAEDLKKTI